MKRGLFLLFLAAALTLAASCGSSTGGGPGNSSDWDKMVWDQDDWA